MVINLSKGQKINLTKEAPQGLSKTTVGLGWDEIKKKGFFSNFQSADLDASLILSSTRVVMEETVYFGNQTSSDGAIHHTGDNLTGAGSGDDEQILVDFSRIAPQITRLTVVANIYNAKAKNQTFEQIKNAYVHVMDEKNQDLVRYELTEESQGATGIIVGDFIRSGSEWEFHAIGRGVVVKEINDFKKYL